MSQGVDYEGGGVLIEIGVRVVVRRSTFWQAPASRCRRHPCRTCFHRSPMKYFASDTM